MVINLGYGYVIIPTGVDRKQYVDTCYNRERISVILDGGQGMLIDCYVDKQSIKEIVFPESSKYLGSCVCLLQQKYKKGVILGVVSSENESQLLKEYDIRLEKVDIDGNTSSIRGNARDGNMSLNVSNKQKEAIININVTGKDNSGKLNITTNNELNIRTTNKVNIESFGTVSVKALDKDNKDEFTEVKVGLNEIYLTSKGTLKIETEGEINIISQKKIDINNGNLTIEP
jgi:hypothetical protein